MMDISAAIACIEAKISTTLPKEYRNWLLAGMPWNDDVSCLPVPPTEKRPYLVDMCKPYRVQIPDESSDVSVLVMYDIHAQRSAGEGLIPKGAIEIGASYTFVEVILLYVKGPLRGEVWLKEWLTLEYEDIDKPENDMTYLASTFQSFLEILIPDPEVS